MKKNKNKIIALLVVVVLFFTQCNCNQTKTEKEDTSTETSRLQDSTVMYISDSQIALIDTSILLYKTSNKEREICTFRYLYRFQSTVGLSGYKSYLQINNGPATQITSNLVTIAGEVTVNTGEKITIHIFSLRSTLVNPSVDTLFSAKCFDTINTCGYPDIFTRSGANYRDLPQINSTITPYTSGPGSVIQQIVIWPPTKTYQQYKP